ncbi:hypothetical protein [Flavonifractor sp. An4]|uniref:DUF7768 domain-containing protein n=1 Tax=Flavonifractor sp. An4 TaxID=1965634 RepID=UPI001FA8BD65|nr:hypothetical protein [Flavonifractor sp. An4]
MKRPLAYITAAWCGEDYKNTEQAARYCRAVYEAGFSPICPTLYLPLFLNDAVPEEHKNGIDISRDLLRRSHVLVVCGHMENCGFSPSDIQRVVAELHEVFDFCGLEEAQLHFENSPY